MITDKEIIAMLIKRINTKVDKSQELSYTSNSFQVFGHRIIVGDSINVLAYDNEGEVIACLQGIETGLGLKKRQCEEEQ